MSSIRLATGVVLCLTRLGSAEQAGVTLAGTVKFATSKRDDAQKRPFEGASVRLCSLERIIETQTDRAGVFRFVDVPPGRYDVMAAGKGWLPRVLKGMELNQTQDEPVEIDMVIGDWQEMPACFRYDAQDCSPTTFHVKYDDPMHRKSGLVLGVVTAAASKGRGKGISAAKVTLFRVGDREPLASKVADKKGRFEFEVQPGIYELTVFRKGFQDVRVKEFLAPRENITRVAIETLRVGWVQACIDESMRAMRRDPPSLPDSGVVGAERRAGAD
jgi:Carboxypeptidase regulatory-like domain